jgi:hypothetical protein
MVVVEWAHLELTLKMLFHAATRMPAELSVEITAQFNAETMMRMIELVTHDAEKDEAHQQAIHQHFKLIANHINDLRVNRNEVVHIDWIRQGPGRAHGVSVKARNKLQLRLRRWMTDEVVTLAYREVAVRRGGFGVPHQYDLKETLAAKGVELPHECRILDVCNPQPAHFD